VGVDGVQPVDLLVLVAFCGVGGQSGVAVEFISGVVYILVVMLIQPNSILPENILGCKPKIIHDHEIVKHGPPKRTPPIIPIALPHKLHRHEMVLFVTGFAGHQVEFGLFIGVGDSRSQVCAEVDVE
jgi:hypothetical protein